MQIIEREYISLDWLSAIFAVCFVWLVLIRVYFKHHFWSFISIGVSNHYFATYGKEIGKTTKLYVSLFWVFRILIFSVFILYVLHRYTDFGFHFQNFVEVLTFCGGFFGLKFFLEKLFVRIKPAFSQYLFYKHSYLNLTSLFLFPLLLWLTYSKYDGRLIYYLAFIGIILLNGFGMFNATVKYRELLLKLFPYFILYLCALEIVPYILMFQLLCNA